MKDNDCASEIISTKQLIEAALDNEVFVCGQIFDDVGGATLHDSSVFTVTLFDSNGTTDDCVESDNNCYKKTGTDIVVGNCQENVCDFSALFSDVKYFANSSAWKVAVAVAEEKAVDENADVNEELMIDSLLAVDVTPHVDFHNVSLGEVSDEELPVYYQACDLFVLPSCANSESFGLVILEAHSFAKPVVSTDLPTGVTFTNLHQKTGLVVSPKDSDSLKEAVNLLLASKELRDKYGEYARKRVGDEFTKEKMAKEIARVYEAVMS